METIALPLDRMSTQEKLIAMEELWDHLRRDEAQLPVQEWHQQILDERRGQVARGEAKFVDWEIAKIRIRARTS